jgi:hypothetical protein
MGVDVDSLLVPVLDRMESPGIVGIGKAMLN